MLKSDDYAERLLARYGVEVEVEKFFEMVEQALLSLPEVGPGPAPYGELTVSEAEVLYEGGVELDKRRLGERDPLARMVAEYAALLQGSLTTAEAAARLGVKSSRVRQRLNSKPPSIYGVRVASVWRIPGFQFIGDRLIPGFERVAARLDPELHMVTVYRWFTRPDPDLEVDEPSGSARSLSPGEWLWRGLSPERLAELAAALCARWLSFPTPLQ